MKNFCVIMLLFFITCSSVLAVTAKIYDKNGFRIGTFKKNGIILEAYDLEGNVMTEDALGNKLPAEELYFYDISGNLRRFSTEKRTIAPVNIELDGKIYKGPLYRRPR